ncbi:beta-galactosidase [Winslowiella sp. 2C04]|uniref:beta-galactosidase n=1 Tax=Winslowiella sp. 2C04 TaxID=3416179 RepID=UPI003CF7E418
MSELYYGVAYYDEYMPEDRLEKDIEMMLATGINIVRIAESTWSTLEPKEGQYNFYHVDRVLDAMHRAGIAVIIGTPTYAIPSWLARKHPEVMVTTPQRQEKYGRRQIMDIVSPVFRHYAENIIRTLLAHVCSHPAIVGYQVDNETKHYDNVGGEMQQRFITHLQQRYPDINQFNADFGLDYWSNRIDNWDDFPPVESTINASLGCAFSRFQRQMVTEYLAWQVEVVKEYATPQQFITHNFDFEWRGYSYGVQPRVDHFAAAKALTVAGVDIYHPSQAQLTGREIGFGGDVARNLKAGDNYLVLETEAQGFAQWTPFPGQLRLQAFSHLAHGAKMVSYWHWHSIHNSFETYWKGLLSHDFSPNPTWREAQTIGADFARIASEVAGLRINNDVAILINNEAMDALNWFKPGETQTNVYNDIVRRFYDALYDHNIAVDIINDIDDSSKKYQAIIVPALYAADDALLGRINRYVEQGGRALISFKSGFSDENVKVRRSAQPGQLTACCGVSYNQFVLPDAVTVRTTAAGFSDADAQPVELWMELLTPTSPATREVARYQHPFWGDYAAVTEADYGSGRAMYLGFLPTKAYISQLLDHLCRDITLASRTTAAHFPLIVRQGRNRDGQQLRFIFNYSASALNFTLSDAARCVLTGEQLNAAQQITLPPWGLRLLLS